MSASADRDPTVELGYGHDSRNRMARMSPQRVPACHGVAIEPDDIGFALGWLEEPPRHRMSVEVVEAVERAPDAELVWELNEPAEFGVPPVTSQTWRESEERTWFGNTLNLALRIDYARERVTVAPWKGNQQILLEALASVALPTVAQAHGSLVLHASAASVGGKAVLLCAPGGSGKSSLMVGLLASGWQAISEDQCVIDVDENGAHRVWPGPNWVRFKQGVPPVPPVSDCRFEAPDKVAWNIDSWMARTPARIDRIIFLEPPGGDEPILVPVSSDAAIPLLSGQATWLQQADDFATAVLPQLVHLAVRVPAFRMRLPRRPDWLVPGIELLTAGS